MGGGTYINFRRGTTGASGAHMAYISRESAVEGREGVITRNIPEEVSEAKDYREFRNNLTSYAWSREDVEIAGHKHKSEPRTHFKATLSFERDVNNEKIKQMTGEWLDKNFDKAKAVGFIHRDTEHTHVHIWLDARQINGRKIDLKPSQYKNLDTQWNKIYSREMGKDEKEHLKKKEETRQYKGRNIKNQPIRVNTSSKKKYQTRELRNYDIEKEGFRGDQREFTIKNIRDEGRNPTPKPGEQRVNKQSDRANGRQSEIGERLERTAQEARTIRVRFGELREELGRVYKEKDLDKKTYDR